MDGMWGFRLWDFVLLSSLLVDLLSVGQILRLLCISIIVTITYEHWAGRGVVPLVDGGQ